ncbi:MAG: hypothetical protein HKN79_00270 [Flavobacteriales bacterium]|nr:hypothetical protein [Flavobacteriales bacterium]
MLRITLCIAILTFFSDLQAQDTLLLLNGKSLIVNITDDSGANVFFDVTKKNGKSRSMDLHKTELFSITKEGEGESILYVQDPDFGYDLSVEDMRFYMAGQNDARMGYSALPSSAGGFVFGMASVFYFEGGYVPFMTPFAYAPMMQIPYIKIRERSVTDPAYELSDYYIEGYNKTARSKKLLQNFAGTIAGVIVGSVIWEATQ